MVVTDVTMRHHFRPDYRYATWLVSWGEMVVSRVFFILTGVIRGSLAPIVLHNILST